MSEHWVDKYLVPLGACSSGVAKSREYPDPQSAWDSWENGSELLWTLWKTCEQDRTSLVLCACDIAERVLPIFEARYPDDNRPREAILIARKFVDGDATLDEVRATADAASAVYAARASSDAARAAAYASEAAARAVYAARAAAYAADATADATAYAIHAAYAAYAAHAADASAYAARAAYAAHAADASADAARAERKAQADIVRKYFPTSPFLKKEK